MAFFPVVRIFKIVFGATCVIPSVANGRSRLGGVGLFAYYIRS
ncbi:MAG TPA: hypothetical protein PLQ06_03980 [Bacteroidales bacterium]|nr:hypothetical protein [Bacteroidales bacterium]HPF03451.1 hypothetical protein [Bacteroidales bacterium]HPJ58865.1 hypothetical protein [Bacteroidales bacterium]